MDNGVDRPQEPRVDELDRLLSNMLITCDTERYRADLINLLGESTHDLNYIMLRDHVERGGTILHHLISKRDRETFCEISRFVEQDRWFELLMVQDNEGCTALHRSVIYKSIDDILHSLGSERSFELLMVEDQNGHTALHRSPTLEFIQYILQYLTLERFFKLLMVKDNNGYTALHRSLNESVISIVSDHLAPEELFNLLMMTDKDGRTVLHHILDKTRYEQELTPYYEKYLHTDYWIQFRELPELWDQQSPSLPRYYELVCSLNIGIIDCISSYLTSESFFDLLMVQDKDGRTALHHILNTEKMKLNIDLLEVDLRIGRIQMEIGEKVGELLPEFLDRLFSVKDGEGRTADDNLQNIITQDPLTPWEDNVTYLHRAVKSRRLHIVKFIQRFLVEGPYLHRLQTQNFEGNTALHLATKGSNWPIIKYLLESVDSTEWIDLMTIKNKEGLTILHCAVEEHLTEMIAYIQEYFEEDQWNNLIGVQDHTGETVLHLVARHREAVFCDALLHNIDYQQKQAVFAIENIDGDTALHIAASQGNKSVVDWLLSATADKEKNELINTKLNSAGRTALDCSKDAGYPEIEELFNYVLVTLSADSCEDEANFDFYG